MLLEFVDAPLMDDLALTEDAVWRLREEIAEQIAEIEGDLVFYIDISDRTKWLQLVDSTLTDLEDLLVQGRFEKTTVETVGILDRYARGPAVLDAATSNAGLVHGDPSGDNVLITDDGYKVIDWQRPLLGPTDLNRSFLDDPELDAQTKKGLLGIEAFLLIRWVTECKKTWIPGALSYDSMIFVAAQDMATGSANFRRNYFRATPLT